jgi:hypothetical protein
MKISDMCEWQYIPSLHGKAATISGGKCRNCARIGWKTARRRCRSGWSRPCSMLPPQTTRAMRLGQKLSRDFLSFLTVILQSDAQIQPETKCRWLFAPPVHQSLLLVSCRQADSKARMMTKARQRIMNLPCGMQKQRQRSKRLQVASRSRKSGSDSRNKDHSEWPSSVAACARIYFQGHCIISPS